IASEIGRDPKQLLIQIAAFKSADAALDSFKTSSTDLLKYARTTTENVRGHILVTAAGNFDAYQMMRLTSLCTVYFIEEIESIKKAHNFPK
ncbi:MAG TPA: hypothetical protein VNR87_08710, partial [Flavisolibacter sp.]|nr:hypothetical protein [Flavisolibacter sp.]